MGRRNAPTVLNAAYAPIQFWDGRAASLEDQAAGPIANPIEMNQTHDVCVSKLEHRSAYVAEFQKVFGPGPVTIGRLRKRSRALSAPSSAAIRLSTAISLGAIRPPLRPLPCADSRSSKIRRRATASPATPSNRDTLFPDGKFHNIGVGVDGEGELTDLGRYEQTKAEARQGSIQDAYTQECREERPLDA